MRRVTIALFLCALTAFPAAAQDVRDDQSAAPAAQTAGGLTLRGVSVNAPASISMRLSTADLQDPTAQQTPSVAVERSGKLPYAVSLAAAAFGVIYNVKTTREALDNHLNARSFPFVWKKTSDPKDKGKLTGIIIGFNGGLMAVSGVVFHKRHPGLATGMNILVAAVTTSVALHNRSIINDAKNKAR